LIFIFLKESANIDLLLSKPLIINRKDSRPFILSGNNAEIIKKPNIVLFLGDLFLLA